MKTRLRSTSLLTAIGDQLLLVPRLSRRCTVLGQDVADLPGSLIVCNNAAGGSEISCSRDDPDQMHGGAR
jgi:hypothetical protein